MGDVITISGVFDALESGGWQPRFKKSNGSYEAKSYCQKLVTRVSGGAFG